MEKQIKEEIDKEWFPVKMHVNPSMREDNHPRFFEQFDHARNYLIDRFYQKYCND